MKPTIMLVDDDPGILAALKRTLRREGYEILLMDNARAALEELQQQDVDLIISDHKMPGMTGIAFLAQVALDWPSTGRILLSGWSNEIPDAEIASARLTAILTKPWDEAELKQTIRDALGTRGGRSAAS